MKKEPYGKLWCSECGGCFHAVIFSRYDPDEEPNGTMFRLMNEFRDEAWSSFPENDTAIKGAELWCPGCGSVYVDIHNRITWYNNQGKFLGNGPEDFKEMYKKLYFSKKELDNLQQEGISTFEELKLIKEDQDVRKQE